MGGWIGIFRGKDGLQGLCGQGLFQILVESLVWFLGIVFFGQFFLEIRKVFLRGVEIFEFSFQGLEVFSIENFFFLLERYYDFLDQVIVLIVIQEFIFIY